MREFLLRTHINGTWLEMQSRWMTAFCIKSLNPKVQPEGSWRLKKHLWHILKIQISSVTLEAILCHEALLLAVSAKLQRFCTACWLGSDAAFHPLPGGKYTATARPVNKKLTRSAAETRREVMQGAGLNQDSLCLKLCFSIRTKLDLLAGPEQICV